MDGKGPVFEKIASQETLFDAWCQVKKKGRAGGIDGQSVESFEAELASNLKRLEKSLKASTYVPGPYQRIYVEKDGKPHETRPLSMANISDKIVQQAARQCIEGIFNDSFLDVSYAYRPGKGPARAIKRIAHIIEKEKVRWVACADIDRCFECIDHRILIEEIQKKVDDSRLTKLIAMWIKNGIVTPQGSYTETDIGVAQGGIISPLLSNV